MIKKISLGILILLLLLLTVLTSLAFYARFSNEQLALLEANSLIAVTSAGPIEYKLTGDSGPYVLYLHGTPGGYDQSIALDGFRVLAPSRPGYLRSPVETGETPAEQADAYAALLDTLGIDSVTVMGASGQSLERSEQD